jgi:hypothetical protein
MFSLQSGGRVRLSSQHPWRQRAIILAASFLIPLAAASAQSVDYGGYRPHYQGYGVNTPGGRGGAVCKVTSLSDTAWPPVPGTLRYCVEESSGPRFVIFEVSGTIRLSQGPLFVKHPYITIAGQTAPSPGILLRGEGLLIDTHDVVVQHIRVRVGNIGNEPSALVARNDAHNVVIDHVSVSWSVWTALGVGAYTPGHPPGEVTFIDSIVAESLACSGVNKASPCDPATYPKQGYSNSRAMGVGNGWGHPPPYVTFLRNISATSNDRHPEIAGGTRTILVNNLVYNPSLTPLSSITYHDGDFSGPSLSVVQGNVLIPGPTTPGHQGYVPPEYVEEGEMVMVRVHPGTHADSKIYLDGNYYQPHCDGTACLASPMAQWMLAKDQRSGWDGVNIRADTPPLSVDSLPLSSALPYWQVEEYLKANAGARPRDRDAVDARIIDEITRRAGSVPNRTSEKAGPGTGSDGFPILAENRRALEVPANPNEVVDEVGRTRIETWLEGFARELEPASGVVAPPRPGPPAAVRIIP